MEKRTARIKAQYAYGSRRDVGNPPERVAELRRDYHAARLAETIQAAIRESGPFTAEQIRELAGIITGAKGVAA
jgi:hypothetical protein